MTIEEKLRLLSVRIESKTEEGQRNNILGSGILWAPNEGDEHMYVFTAAHVVHGYDKLVVRYWDKDENSYEINIDESKDIALHEKNNYEEYKNKKSKGILLKNDVAVLRCKREDIEYLNYDLKLVKDIPIGKSLILRGFPQKIQNSEKSITLGKEIHGKYDIAEHREKYFNYIVQEKLPCEEKNEHLKGLSGSGIFVQSEKLMLVGIHSYGDASVYLNSVTAMNVELIRELCQMKNWDVPKLNIKLSHTEPDDKNWEKIDDEFLKQRKTSNEERLKSFLKGGNCTWALISNNSTVKRKLTQQIASEINNKNIIGILSAGGEGKSTVLMQVSNELNNLGYAVYWNIKYAGKTTYDMKLKPTTDSVVFVIDDASGDKEFEHFALEASRQGYKIIFAARENEWKIERTKAGSEELEREFEEPFTLKEVTEDEAVEFARLIIDKMESDKDEETIKKLFTKKNEGFLLAAMLMVIYSKPLEAIVRDILAKIGKENLEILKVLALLCYIENLELEVNGDLTITLDLYKILYESYKIKKNEINSLLCNEVRKTNRNIIRTRHSAISKIILKCLIGEEGKFEISDLLYDFVLSFYNKENSNGKKAIPPTLLNNIHPLMRAILKDIYIHDIGFARQEIARIIVETYISRGDVGRLWALLEYDEGNIGEDTNEKYSSRWILKRLTEKCPQDGSVYIIWAGLEIKHGNKGESVTEENSARWILKEGIEKCPEDGNIYIKWVELEDELENIGENINDENSARWILKKGNEMCPTDGNIYVKWAELEKKQGNIGKDTREENSARWIANEGIKKCSARGEVYIMWIELEAEQRNIGKDINQEYSARWIVNKGIENCPTQVNVYIKGAELEAKQGKIGKDIYEKNSARWILNKGIRNCPTHGNVYINWADLEIAQGNIGEDIDEEYSARWILNEGLKNCHTDANIYNKWAELEAEQGNIGKDENEENSVRWILNQSIRYFPSVISSYIQLASIEGEFDTQKSIDLLIESIKYGNGSLSLLALFQAKNGNFSSEDPYCVRNCINMMLKKNEERAIYVAYLCYKLYGSDEIAESYKSKLTSADIEVFEQEKFFKVRYWEKGWIERSKLASSDLMSFETQKVGNN